MKIRKGFISNSSSSSFIAVCTRKPVIVHQTLLQWNFCDEEALDEATREGDTRFEHANYGIVRHKSSGLYLYVTCGEVRWIGLDIESRLRADKRVSECKAELVKMFANAGIEVTANDLEFESGECSSG